MKSKTSLFNRGVFLNDLRQFSWFGTAYLLALLFLVPLRIYLNYSSEIPENYSMMKNVFWLFTDSYQTILLLIVPVLLALRLFRYLQERNQAVLVHSLPIRRETLLHTHAITGVIMLVLPVLLTALACWALLTGLNLEAYFSGADIGLWLGTTVLIDLVMFTAAMFVGICTGLSVMQGILTYIMLLLPTGLGTLVLFNLQSLVYGLTIQPKMEGTLLSLSPLTVIMDMGSKSLSINQVIVFVILCLVFYLLSFVLYRVRKVESAGQTVAFSWMRPIFKYGVTFCFMLTGGYILQQALHSPGWILFGYLLGSVFGYLLADILLCKSWPEPNQLKGYAVYAGITVLVLLGIHFDMVGYEARVPALDSLKNAYCGYRVYDGKITYTDRAVLDSVIEFHQQLIKDKDQLFPLAWKEDNRPTQIAVFSYELYNGRKIVRQYTVPSKEYGRFLKPIYESEEYRVAHYDVLRINQALVDKIVIEPQGDLTEIRQGKAKRVVIVDPAQIKEAITILQRERRGMTYEDMTDGRDTWANVKIMLSDDRFIYASWDKSFMEFSYWLKEHNYYSDCRIMPSDIDHIVVEKVAQGLTGGITTVPGATPRIIRDKGEIEECLQTYSAWCYPPQYRVDFYAVTEPGYDNAYIDNSEAGTAVAKKAPVITGFFSKENVPDFLKDI